MNYHFEGFKLDCEANVLKSSEGSVQLRPQLIKVLMVLLENPHEIVSTDQLLEQVWGQVVVSPSTIAQCIREIRKELGDDAHNPRFIQTVHRVGYRWICDVKKVEQKPAKSRSMLFIGLVLAIFLIGSSFFILNYLQGSTNSNDSALSLKIAALDSMLDPVQRQQGLSRLEREYPDSELLELAKAETYLFSGNIKKAHVILNSLSDQIITGESSAKLSLLNARLAGTQSQYLKQQELASNTLLEYKNLPEQLQLALEIELFKALSSLGSNEGAEQRFNVLIAQSKTVQSPVIEQGLKKLRLQWLSRWGSSEQFDTEYKQLILQYAGPENNFFRATIRLIGVAYYYEIRNYSKAQTVLEQLDLPIEDYSESIQAHIYLEKMLLSQSHGDISKALLSGQKAMTLFQQLGAHIKLAGVRLNMALIYLRKGDPGTAESFFHKALESFTEVNYIRGQAIAWGNLSILQKKQGDLVLSLDYAQLALELFQQSRDEKGEYRTLFNMGRTELKEGRLDSARTHFDQALSYYRQKGLKVLESHILCSLSKVDRLQGDLDGAVERSEQAWQISEQHSAEAQMIISQFHMGESYRLSKDYPSAMKAFEELKKLAVEHKSEDWVLLSRVRLAAVFNDMKNYSIARDELNLLMSQMNDRVDADDQLQAYYQLAISYYHLNDNSKAQQQLDAAKSLFTEGVDKRWLLYVNLLQHQIDQQLDAEYQQWFFEQLKGRQDWELEQIAKQVFGIAI